MSEETGQTQENEGLQNLLKKYDSDWAALAGELYSQTGKLREKNRTLESTISGLQQDKTDLEGKLPKDGSRVYSKAESERIDALLKLEAGGKTGDAEAIASALRTGAEAQQKAHRSDTREGLRKLGYDPSDRLLKDFDGVSLTVSQGDDKKFVGKVKAGDEETAFGDWAKAQGLDGDLERYRTQPGGVVVLPQVQGGGGGGPKTAEQIQQDKQKTGDYQI